MSNDDPISEYFQVGIIGLHFNPGCFVCGGNMNRLLTGYAYVESAETAQRILKLFDSGAQLDPDPPEGFVTVQFGVCDKHGKNFDLLCSLIQVNNTINAQMVMQAIELSNPT